MINLMNLNTHFKMSLAYNTSFETLDPELHYVVNSVNAVSRWSWRRLTVPPASVTIKTGCGRTSDRRRQSAGNCKDDIRPALCDIRTAR